ncbi:MAG: glycerophosphodiester phosphodiesterase [Vicinamibacteria bacterium]
MLQPGFAVRALAPLLTLSLAYTAPDLMGAEPPGKRAFDLQGHRGGRGLWPENTLAAFAGALTLGVTTLELDCAVTRDGVVIVSHDPLLNPDVTRDEAGRFLERHGAAFFALRYDEVLRYDVGRLKPGTPYAARYPEQAAADGQRVPRLADVFALVKQSGNGSVRFNIETKVFPPRPDVTLAPEPFAEAVVRVVREAGMAQRTAIQSFDWRTLEVVRRIAPELPTVALTSQRPGDDTIQFGQPGPSPWLGGLDADDFGRSVPKLVKASGARVWSPNFLDLAAEQAAEAQALGLSVIPWTINETADMQRILGWGVDGIISDRPDRLRAVLREKGMPLPEPTPVRP